MANRRSRKAQNGGKSAKLGATNSHGNLNLRGSETEGQKCEALSEKNLVAWISWGWKPMARATIVQLSAKRTSLDGQDPAGGTRKGLGRSLHGIKTLAM